jgi:hypothetical protein
VGSTMTVNCSSFAPWQKLDLKFTNVSVIAPLAWGA